jgi:hypothetical protein
MAKTKRDRRPPIGDEPAPEPAYFDEWELDDGKDVRFKPRRPKGEVEPRKKPRARRPRAEVEYF